ncbi:Hypp2253 [Branchiostoma lanceolatum]|uniref:Hypp2253 protein n=1 Tax=Branchiostoma lanceolatum TaxID=7740 RepID=A0A8J9ZPK0_BRALA|nr:Hypp2253 [Branchiostoma lanceolatum]
MEAMNTTTATAFEQKAAASRYNLFYFGGGVLGFLILAAMLFWLYRRVTGQEQLYIPDIELLEPENPTATERCEQLDKKLKECGL